MAGRRKLAGKDALDDLVMIDQVKEDKVLTILKNRYMEDSIYTNIGPVLIAINPFKLIKPLYTEARVREYRGKKYFELSPHVYALSDAAYSAMISFRENQCVIISGESGSGKTETSKIFMQYISGVSGKSKTVQETKDKMLGSNPVLEAFGNAKTVNNNNSSRFGKYMEILFDLGGDPRGGRVTNYLLEKSRVCQPGQGERNFHAFYQLISGASPQQKQDYFIETVEYFYYLNQTGCYTVDGIDDHADWEDQMNAWNTLGVSVQEQEEVIRVLAAVLWLGNVAFQEKQNEVSEVADPQVLDIVARLLMVDPAHLDKALCNRKMSIGVGARAENVVKPNTAAQADFCRDTLSKALYSKLFDWIVDVVNRALQNDGLGANIIQIGVLDIYGFEIFQYNSFEQLCINFVNEKLQQIFIELTLKQEQEEYVREGIPWREIQFYNNKPVCDLIEGNPGLLTVCDDCCNTSKNDAMFMQDLGRMFSSHANITAAQNDFTVQHFAGQVRYEAAGFLTKNKDTLFDDLIEVMQASSAPFVQMHKWAEIVVSTGQKQRPPTVGKMFKGQVKKLMDALTACTPHYIRCIKPNNQKTPNNWDEKNIKRQVQYLGLLENVNVRKAGYSFRSTFERFVERYKLLSEQILSGQARGPPQQLVGVLCQSIGWTVGQEYVMGKTKIFIQDATILFHLEDLLDRKINDAVVEVQKAWRSYKQKRYYMQSRYDSWELVNNKKKRRKASVSREYIGDYVDFSYNSLVSAMLQVAGPKEKVLFADRCKVASLRGKQGVFGSLFGGKAAPLHQPRFIMLSDKALYSFSFIVDPQDGIVKSSLNYRVVPAQIKGLTVSPFADNYMVFHFNPGASAPMDMLLTCRRKTEFIGLFKKAIPGLDLRFTDKDEICVNVKKNRILKIIWMEDDSVPGGESLKPVSRAVEIRAASGLSGNMVPTPEKPAALDMAKSSRPMLHALHDYAGNGVDELTFRSGDIIVMLKDLVDGWYEGSLNGVVGFVPGEYVEKKIANPNGGPKPGGGFGAPKAGGGPPKMGGGAGAPPSSGGAGAPPSFGGGGPKLGAGGGASPKIGGAAGAGAVPKFGGNAGAGAVPNFGGVGAAPKFGGAAASPTAGAVPKFGAAAGGAAKQPAVAAIASKVVVKTKWQELKTDEGEVYYWNEETEESAWDKPQEMIDAEKGGAGPKCAQPGCTSKPFGGDKFCVSHRAGGGAAAAPKVAVKAAPVKSDWVKLLDDASGDYYYFNEVSGESSWDPPPGFRG